MSEDISSALRGLRAHDVHQGLREVDRNVGQVGKELKNTQLIGMAAALAATIKGQDVVGDAQALETVAAEQLDIDRWAFPRVVKVLQDVDFVRGVVESGGDIRSFLETVPESFERLYGTLGDVWTSRNPGEIEKSLVGSVEILSHGPMLTDDLDIDPAALSVVLQVGRDAEAIRTVEAGEQIIAYSPFFAYEHPERIGETLKNSKVEDVRRAFAGIRAHQGMPNSRDPNSAMTTGLIEAGLVAGPAVERPDGNIETFAVAPYGWTQKMLTIQRPIVDKALAIVAAVRTGQYFGGRTALTHPEYLLQALLDNRATKGHSSTRRQYAVLRRLGIIQFVRDGTLYGIQLIDNADNRGAVKLAMELISTGEALSSKEAPLEAQDALVTQGNYLAPIQTPRQARKRHRLDDKLVQDLYESAMGRHPID